MITYKTTINGVNVEDYMFNERSYPVQHVKGVNKRSLYTVNYSMYTIGIYYAIIITIACILVYAISSYFVTHLNYV